MGRFDFVSNVTGCIWRSQDRPSCSHRSFPNRRKVTHPENLLEHNRGKTAPGAKLRKVKSHPKAKLCLAPGRFERSAKGQERGGGNVPPPDSDLFLCGKRWLTGSAGNRDPHRSNQWRVQR